MRKIEREMVEAIRSLRDWRKDNTEVSFDMNSGVSTVYLHDNPIAEVGEDFVRVDHCGWQTNTTKSRLNAILNTFARNCGVYQENFVWYFMGPDGSVEFDDVMEVPFCFNL